jgi:hypothetical protein
MRESNGQTGIQIPPSQSLNESFTIIHHFMEWFSPEELQKQMWELVLFAMGSKDADGWSNLERSNMLFLYQELTRLGKALVTVDKQLTPLFAIEE